MAGEYWAHLKEGASRALRRIPYFADCWSGPFAALDEAVSRYVTVVGSALAISPGTTSNSSSLLGMLLAVLTFLPALSKRSTTPKRTSAKRQAASFEVASPPQVLHFTFLVVVRSARSFSPSSANVSSCFASHVLPQHHHQQPVCETLTEGALCNVRSGK